MFVAGRVRVQIGDLEERITRRLQLDPLGKCTDEMADVQSSRRAHPRHDAHALLRS
jgi:hypothetical protein